MSEVRLGPGTLPIHPEDLPEGWQALQLKSFCDFIQGGRKGLTKQNYLSSGFPAFSAAGQDGFVDVPEFHDTDAVILSAIGANCGRCFLASGDWTTLANVQAVVPSAEQASARFLHYRVNRDDYWPRSGSAQPFIKPSDMKLCWLALPPLPQQEVIGSVLKVLDTAIHETEALIVKLKAVKQGLLHDLLTRGIDANGELRLPQSEAPHLYKSSLLGWIPTDWETPCFSALQFQPLLGVGVRGASEDAANYGLLKMGNLRENNEIDLRSVELVAASRVLHADKLLLSEGDLLFNTRNTPELVGKTCSWRDVEAEHVFDNNILRARIPSHIGSGHFFAHYLGSEVGRRRVRRLATGTTSVAAIYWKDLKGLRVPAPSTQEQNAIHRIIDEHDKSRAFTERNMIALHEAKLGLMHDLLTGRVRVTPLLDAATA
ncbi:restriction endonuclease subunit S [Xanthomonas axonopodis pv. maculifoliigardeniae]|uniref:restriction endonuclease subunit S n=1 Tax=Xanthomonas TaxID=338 RepID=UPI0004DF6352|nr:restriction endonuclease subunit S [Xanthomonas euvesicatoria]